MKKIIIFFLIIIILTFSFFFFIKKNIGNGSLLNNKNHEYVLAIIQGSADSKKKNYLSDFYYDRKKSIEKIKNNDIKIIEEYNNLFVKNKRINLITRAEIYCFLGNIYFKNKDYANAFYCYKKALYFSPYSIETKYNIRNLVDFADKINVPEKLLEINNQNSISQLKLFIHDKESSLNKKAETIKTDLKQIYSKNTKLNENVKSSNKINKDNLKKELSSYEKEKDNTEKQIKSLYDKSSKQDIYEIQNIKKELLKKFPDIIKPFRTSIAFWEKLEKSVIKKLSGNSVNTERKTLQDKYFANDIFLHKKNVWNNLIADFQYENEQKYDSPIKRNISFINYKKQSVFNNLKANETDIFEELFSIDEKAVNFFNRRAKQLFEEKDNISSMLNDISAKKKELYASINGNTGANSQKKKNLQKELDKIKEKEKALRLESADCSRDLAELEIIKENILMYNEINLLEIKNYVFAESIRINKTLSILNEHINVFCEKQKILLNSQQNILKNINSFDYTALKKYGESLVFCDENFCALAEQQKNLYEQQKLLIKNYINLIFGIEKYIKNDDIKDKDGFFSRFKSFMDRELKIFNDKDKNLNKIYEFDRIYKIQTDIAEKDVLAENKINVLANVLETNNAIKGVFPKEQPVPKKNKSKKSLEKTIVSKMKNYKTNTDAVQEEVSSKKKKKKDKKKKK